MKKPHILIVDADKDARAQYEAALQAIDGAEIQLAATPELASAELRGGQFDLLLVNIGEGSQRDLALLGTAREIDAELPMIVVTRTPHVESATASVRLGAGDYLTKPLDPAVLVESARRLIRSRRREAEYELLRRQVERPYSFDDMIGGCADA